MVQRVLFIAIAAATFSACAPLVNGANSGGSTYAKSLGLCSAENLKQLSASPLDRADYPLANAVDGDTKTFATTDTLTQGDSQEFSFGFQEPCNLTTVQVVDDYTNDYNMGDLEVLVSSNSSNGKDGDWRLVSALNAANHGFKDGDGQVTVNENGVTWVKLKMSYNGTGAYGGTPAFYLSEIKFNAVP